MLPLLLCLGLAGLASSDCRFGGRRYAVGETWGVERRRSGWIPPFSSCNAY